MDQAATSRSDRRPRDRTSRSRGDDEAGARRASGVHHDRRGRAVHDIVSVHRIGADVRRAPRRDLEFVEVVGASGGGAPSGTLGGLGAVVDGTIVVTPGQPLYVSVGGVGAAGAGPATVAAGGFNGGGAGSFASFSGGGGGGASDVRTVPSDQPATTLASRLVVAGAGGGASYSLSGPGGHAGQPGGSPASATPAQPGTSTGGGTGAPSALGSSTGEDGSVGQGGRSGDQLPCCTSFGGGGGGAGLYGGGGGSGARGGAGGSSLVPDDGTASLATSRGDGSITLSWMILPLPTPPAPAFTSPAFTSPPAAATFHRGQPGTFTITTSGDPLPMLQLKAGGCFLRASPSPATVTARPRSPELRPDGSAPGR